MTKWESPNDVLKQLPPVVLGTWRGLGILPPLQPPTITSPLVKAGRVLLAGITEGTTLPTKNIQVQAQVSSWSPNLILSNHECRWRSRSVPLGLPLDRRNTRSVSTEIPRSWSVLSRVNPQIMATNWKWGSPPASTSSSYPFAIP